MKVFISHPHGSAMGGLAPQLKDKWRMAVKYANEAYNNRLDLQFISPLKNEIHGEFLTRLWVTEILDADCDEFLISELDFIPYRDSLRKLLETVDGAQLALLGAHYVTRIYKDTDDTRRDSGKLQAYEAPKTNLPLLAPWFLYLNLAGRRDVLPPENWLAAGGPFNDAGNLGIVHLEESGFLKPDNHAFLEFRDAWPVVHGVHYPKIGTHAFFSREYDVGLFDPAREICWHHCKRPLTAGDHLDNVRRLV